MTMLPVDMRRISKRFGDVQALDEVTFSLERGEVHSLLGENGAGKTTLMNVLSGLYQADSGEIFINGEKVAVTCPKDALDRGVCMVHQHFELISNFTALENIILGKEGGKPVIDMNAQRQKVVELVERYSLAVDLDRKIKQLAVGIQQKVEILKALYRGASILILDEPTTMLTPQEVDALFATIRSLTREGLTVVLITHKIREVLAISDRITVMRRGRLIETIQTRETSQQKLVALMIGEGGTSHYNSELNRAEVTRLDEPMVQVQGLGVQDERKIWLAQDVSLDIRAGEVVGLVGVAGNGQREVAEAIYGLRPVRSGRISVVGEDITTVSIKDRLAKGIALIPEDRIRQGILPRNSLAETLILGPHNFLFTHGSFDLQRARAMARKAIKEYNIAAPNEDIAASRLSGGNIQKVVAARAFLMSDLVNLRLIIAFNPTRGLDIMTTRFIHDRLMQMRNEGKGVLLISEDLDESLRLCDRVYVLYKGSVVGEFERAQFDPYKIGALMVGGEG